jgi:hypothetical protein
VDSRQGHFIAASVVIMNRTLNTEIWLRTLNYITVNIHTQWYIEASSSCLCYTGRQVAAAQTSYSLPLPFRYEQDSYYWTHPQFTESSCCRTLSNFKHLWKKQNEISENSYMSQFNKTVCIFNKWHNKHLLHDVGYIYNGKVGKQFDTIVIYLFHWLYSVKW